MKQNCFDVICFGCGAFVNDEEFCNSCNNWLSDYKISYGQIHVKGVITVCREDATTCDWDRWPVGQEGDSTWNVFIKDKYISTIIARNQEEARKIATQLCEESSCV